MKKIKVLTMIVTSIVSFILAFILGKNMKYNEYDKKIRINQKDE